MWKVSHTETVTAPAASIWNRWSHVENWPEYDKSLTSTSINGSFELGSVITLQSKKLPKTKFTLAIVTSDIGFAMVSKLPLAKIQMTYHIEEKSDSTEFTQSISISGPLFWLYSLFFGNSLQRTLVSRMQQLAELVSH